MKFFKTLVVSAVVVMSTASFAEQSKPESNQADMEQQEMRRVVTGLDASSHAVVLFDGRMPLKPVAPRHKGDQFLDH